MQGTVFQTDWGWVGLAATERGVRAVVLPKATKRAVERELRRVANGNSTPTFVLPPQGGGKYLRAAHEAIIAYLQGRARTFDLPRSQTAATDWGRGRLGRAVYAAIDSSATSPSTNSVFVTGDFGSMSTAASTAPRTARSTR